MAQGGPKRWHSKAPRGHQSARMNRRGPCTPNTAEPLDSPLDSSREGPPELRRRDFSPYPKTGFLLLLARLRPTHSLSRLLRALVSTHTQTYSNSDSLTLRLIHTQTYSYSDPLTHRPLRLIHTLTQTHLYACSLTPRHPHIQTHSHSHALTEPIRTHTQVLLLGDV